MSGLLSLTYEQQRQQNIQNNSKRFDELGIISYKFDNKDNTRKHNNKRTRAYKPQSISTETYNLRRSTRNIVVLDDRKPYESIELSMNNSHSNHSSNDRARINIRQSRLDHDSIIYSNNITSTTPTRQIHCSTIHMNDLLGKHIQYRVNASEYILPPKQSVLCTICCNDIVPRFNRYNGYIQLNNMIVLFCNIDTHNSTYNNIFTRNHSNQLYEFIWYASSHLSMESPLLQKLNTIAPLSPAQSNTHTSSHNGISDCEPSFFTRTKTKPVVTIASTKYESNDDNDNNSNNNNHDDMSVLLFCRYSNTPHKSKHYIYCGELQLISINASQQPIATHWLLRDTQQLTKSVHFNELLE